MWNKIYEANQSLGGLILTKEMSVKRLFVYDCVVVRFIELRIVY